MIGLEIQAGAVIGKIDSLTERLRDLVAMGPLYSCRGVGLSQIDQELVRCGFAQVWDTDSDGWKSVSDTDLGRSLICAH